MKPAAFDYLAAHTIDEATALAAEYGDDARFLAGGQSLVPLMNFRMAQPGILIDLNRCRELDFVRRDPGRIAIGAMLRQRLAETDSTIRQHCPLIMQALRHAGHPTIRNRGTVGGMLAHADPTAELLGVALALDAEMLVASAADRRRIAAADFFVGELTTALKAGELLIEIHIPDAPQQCRSAFQEVRNHGGHMALLGVAARFEVDAKGVCVSARLAAIGAATVPRRLVAAERCLVGERLGSAEATAAAAAAAHDEVDPPDTLAAPAVYRKRLAAAMVRRVVADALLH
jgi:carbon-monoxide dehydrogenase medium subunit